MKTKEQIEKEIEKLKDELDDDDLPGIISITKFERLHALSWVLEIDGD